MAPSKDLLEVKSLRSISFLIVSFDCGECSDGCHCCHYYSYNHPLNANTERLAQASYAPIHFPEKGKKR